MTQQLIVEAETITKKLQQINERLNGIGMLPKRVRESTHEKLCKEYDALFIQYKKVEVAYMRAIANKYERLFAAAIKGTNTGGTPKKGSGKSKSKGVHK